MPSFVTHHIFAEEVKNQLNIESRNIIDLNEGIYFLASQSFDLFKYSLSKHKTCVRLCQTCHRINTNNYFINLINIAKDSQNKELISFIYGSITHNILDANLHPFIVYKTGIYNGKEETKKYDGLHTLLETQYDMFNYERYYHKTLIHKNLKNNFFPKIKVKKDTINSINNVFKDMYDFNGGKYLLKGYQDARNTIELIRKENFINRPLFNTIHLIKNNFLPYYLFYKNNLGFHYLNVNHQEWKYPSDNSIIKKDSLIDLYNNSVITCADAINKLQDYFNGQGNIDSFLEIIGNKAYIRGIDCKIIEPLKYFEF